MVTGLVGKSRVHGRRAHWMVLAAGACRVGLSRTVPTKRRVWRSVVGGVFEGVELVDGHVGAGGDGRFDAEPVPEPPQPGVGHADHSG